MTVTAGGVMTFRVILLALAAGLIGGGLVLAYTVLFN